jgi:uncharacterized membrane protein YeaQ/YmgE (transglycosylase-associated protein family)
MTSDQLLVACGTGIIAGWLASLVMKSKRPGLLRDMVLGVVGAVLGAWLIPKSGITLAGGPWAMVVVSSFAGAAVVLAGSRFLRS